MGLLGNATAVAKENSLVSPAHLEWIEVSRSGLSRFLSQETEEFFQHAHSANLPYGNYFDWVWSTYPQPATVEEVIFPIEKAPLPNILVALAKAMPGSSNGDQMKEILEQSEGEASIAEAIAYVERYWTGPGQFRMKDYLLHAEETQHRLVFTLRRVYQDCYHSAEESLAQLGRRALESFEQRYRSDPSRFLSKALKLDPQRFDGTVVVHVSPLIGQWVYLVLNESPPIHWAILGSEVSTATETLDPDRELQGLLRLLSDKTRVEILRRLGQKPWYGAELAQALQLTPAAISYQMSFLFEADLVAMEKKGRRYYYSLNRDRLDAVWDRGRALLLGDIGT